MRTNRSCRNSENLGRTKITENGIFERGGISSVSICSDVQTLCGYSHLSVCAFPSAKACQPCISAHLLHSHLHKKCVLAPYHQQTTKQTEERITKIQCTSKCSTGNRGWRSGMGSKG